ncbi:hypothetical protein V8G54_010387 [Vigna mungo]|uniref:Uncharacterized protein n=1 Tax=Vigna mungo TaxID=3915 RepID=A0AAQ3NWZ1_VIGMU
MMQQQRQQQQRLAQYSNGAPTRNHIRQSVCSRHRCQSWSRLRLRRLRRRRDGEHCLRQGRPTGSPRRDTHLQHHQPRSRQAQQKPSLELRWHRRHRSHENALYSIRRPLALLAEGPAFGKWSRIEGFL